MQKVSDFRSENSTLDPISETQLQQMHEKSSHVEDHEIEPCFSKKELISLRDVKGKEKVV